jgi:hypothetical protein
MSTCRGLLLPTYADHLANVLSLSLQNEELGYAVAVGAQPRNTACAAGLIYINITDIAKPFSPGCAGQDGYVHDAQVRCPPVDLIVLIITDRAISVCQIPRPGQEIQRP